MFGGEGIIVSCAPGSDPKIALPTAKWKCMSEPQFGNIKILKELNALIKEKRMEMLLSGEVMALLKGLLEVTGANGIEEDGSQLARTLSGESR